MTSLLVTIPADVLAVYAFSVRSSCMSFYFDLGKWLFLATGSRRWANASGSSMVTCITVSSLIGSSASQGSLSPHSRQPASGASGGWWWDSEYTNPRQRCMCDGSASSEFCGEETFKRLLLRFKHIQQSYYRM